MNIEQIKVRREGREGEVWVKTRTGIETCSGEPVCVVPLGFKGRIINLPELEYFAIEAMAAMGAIVARSHDDPLGTSKVIDMRKIADAFLKKYTKPD